VEGFNLVAKPKKLKQSTPSAVADTPQEGNYTKY
jgi:hypothetical protein